MDVSLFDFALPERLIATRPAAPRDAARMLVVGEALEDRAVRDLPEFLRPGDLLVFNDTRVLPARLYGMRGPARIEVLLHKETAPGQWLAFARPGKRLAVGDRIDFAADFLARVVEKREGGEILLHFQCDGIDFRDALSREGQMPLPPYIARSRPTDRRDAQDYQTMYARHDGSVAAPTAGLHFTPALMAACHARGVGTAYVTLHVGAGTFQPVKVEDTRTHAMHAEYAQVSAETAAAVGAARAAGGRIVAVGTTSLRTLESAADADGNIQAFNQDTAIFITPGYPFRAVDMLLTNFHLPKSTLFMLVSAFSGLERMQAAYAHAIKEDYRFYSYGDACLLTRY